MFKIVQKLSCKSINESKGKHQSQKKEKKLEYDIFFRTLSVAGYLNDLFCHYSGVNQGDLLYILSEHPW